MFLSFLEVGQVKDKRNVNRIFQAPGVKNESSEAPALSRIPKRPFLGRQSGDRILSLHVGKRGGRFVNTESCFLPSAARERFSTPIHSALYYAHHTRINVNLIWIASRFLTTTSAADPILNFFVNSSLFCRFNIL